jgi:sugar lactone lactonase YvrE
MHVLFSPNTWNTWRNYYVSRTPPAPLGSLDGVVYFPKSYAAATGGLIYEQPPEEPVQGPEGQVIIGKPGGARGQFSAPAGLAVDREGNLYVADSGNHRIQKFDGDGHFLGTFGSAGGNEGQFNEPWGVAVDGEGNIYVADSWNHRIQKFDSNFQFLKAWGQAFVEVGKRQPEPLELFGPRSIAIDADGNVWVTDTGNKRVLKFDSDGNFLAQYGVAGVRSSLPMPGIAVSSASAPSLSIWARFRSRAGAAMAYLTSRTWRSSTTAASWPLTRPTVPCSSSTARANRSLPGRPLIRRWALAGRWGWP